MSTYSLGLVLRPLPAPKRLGELDNSSPVAAIDRIGVKNLSALQPPLCDQSTNAECIAIRKPRAAGQSRTIAGPTCVRQGRPSSETCQILAFNRGNAPAPARRRNPKHTTHKRQIRKPFRQRPQIYGFDLSATRFIRSSSSEPARASSVGVRKGCGPGVCWSQA